MAIVATNAQIPQHPLIVIFLLAMLLLTTSCSTQGQTKISKKALKYYEEGKEHLNWDRFGEAEVAFSEAVKIQPDYSNALQRLGWIYIKGRKYDRAYEILSQVAANNERIEPALYFELAKLCLATGNFKAAPNYINQYIASNISPDQMKVVRRLQENLTFAKEQQSDSRMKTEWDIQPIQNLNTEHREYFPALTADFEKLIFTRNIRTGMRSQEDIYESLWNGQSWSNPSLLPGSINTVENEGAPFISADGRTIYFTKCESEYGKGGCDIWIAEKKGKAWQKARKLSNIINTNAKETQPCISADGQTVYFSSTRQGGFGGLDIWVSKKQKDGTWGKPENAGSTINTAFDEQRPFIHPDNQTLYFTSNGHPGFGHSDLFMIKHENGEWQNVINLGPQINSYEDEEGIYVSLDGTTGYFATDRYSKKPYQPNHDIYQFTLVATLRPLPSVFVKGRIYDASSKKGIGTRVQITNLETETAQQFSTDSISGDYLICLPSDNEYAMNISAPGYLIHSQHFSLDDSEKDFQLDVGLEKIEAGKSVVLNNIFFETDSYELKPSSKTELNILVNFLKSNPTVSINIEGHTDNIGTKDYNLQLSKKRAKAVKEYIVEKGIDNDRMTFEGFGDQKPLADNDTEEGRAKNRRTEFRVKTK